MESTGFFFAAFQTGRNVATIVVISAITISTINDTGPNTKSEAPKPDATSVFKMLQVSMVAIVASTTQIEAITKDSEKKILKT